MTIAVLAVQGAFIEHEKNWRNWVQTVLNLEKQKICHSIMTGWCFREARVLYRGNLKELGMSDTIKSQIESGMPVLATCAGMILLAEELKAARQGIYRPCR